MLLQHSVELFDLRLQGSARQTEEDDAGVGEALVEDQLPEITIGNHQNALLFVGNRKTSSSARLCGWSWEIAETSWPRCRRCAMRRKSALWSNRNFIQAWHQRPLSS